MSTVKELFMNEALEVSFEIIEVDMGGTGQLQHDN